MPASLPFVFSGLKVSAAFSVLGAVFGEWVGANGGLGYEILVLNNQSATADMFAVIVLLSLLGIAMFTLVVTAERLVLPWYHEARDWRAERTGAGLGARIDAAAASSTGTTATEL
jgi:ABC-type nitrate/sulfonate/bicarbonate transport system permease component